MLQLENTKIISNKHLIGDFYILILRSPKIVKHARPGQFVNILVSNSTEPLLRRPFSIYDADTKKGELKVLYCVKGKGTNILKTLAKGRNLSITGPHGNGFHVHEDHKNILLVGGGFGTAPLSYLAKEHRHLNIFAAVGGRTKDLIFCEKDLKNCDAKIFIATDDGSYGEKGLVIQPVEKILKTVRPDSGQARMTGIDEIFTCGPVPMMKAVAEVAKKYDVPCQVSMEEKMACGIGVCLGCACKTKEGYKTVCTQGPVFQSSYVDW
ncbi:hypothetical protein COY62_02635 [bacterium (Candidatus Howlettbacteria) CG_4_10_14_0_8_um_filter_40_9]|nr:MAG: hypothetical protein COY62_02635 [bacterium (Candidatus Howlettbacteria) CG_4_10_14_0_8_um_filter_40_9]